MVDNVVDGFDLHKLENGEYIRMFSTGLAKKPCPKQVLFGEDGKVVIGGSDHGSIYVFDRRTGEVLQVLKHADDGMVQTITVGCTFRGQASNTDMGGVNRQARRITLARSWVHRPAPAVRNPSFLCGHTRLQEIDVQRCHH